MSTKYYIIITTITVSLFFSCKSDKSNLKTIEFDNIFSIDIPKSWIKKEYDAIDFKANFLITEKNDTIHIEYGNYKDLFDDTVQVFSMDQIKKYDSLGLDTKNLVFSKKPHIDQSQGTFLNEFYYYDTISNLRAKLRFPKNEKSGITGISFDSINSLGKDLKIYAKNLDEKEEKLLKDAFKTIKINDQ
ncbi:hypothetical protein HN014_08860 [Aquimarina sp. TRL1]|uniref:hypothetical protein n=1 Tax=Aquimarina sp. (strain TRL1) TaxID=2736252 RepID=UPI00158E84EA|nr:hypothetical protein [Aquimarina sp. TRL1]QKX05020.1 hypothetical protein HN014_08860 [Aquimarina sp. TRL1]